MSAALQGTHRIARGVVAGLGLLAVTAAGLDAQTTPTKRKPGPTRPGTTTSTAKPKTTTAPTTAPAPAPAPAAKPEPVPEPAPVREVAPEPARQAAPAPRSSRQRDDAPWYAHPERTWFTVGLATANGGLGCAICRPNSTRAVAANAAAGWTIRPRLVVGVQGQTWLDVFGDGFDQTMLHAQAIARWYPFARQPLSITGGLGGLAYRVDDGAFVLRAQTVAAQMTVGWEVPMRSKMTFTPFVAVLTTMPARLRGANGFSLADDARFGLVQGGVAVSWF
ncbi:MAG: hypothetical protein MUF53_00960 [Gemmatimonadaceae bacterium]|jgi:hypothetical protein|nr:hypothetical protein [Gemmatimonadaceae bacterium]